MQIYLQILFFFKEKNIAPLILMSEKTLFLLRPKLPDQINTVLYWNFKMIQKNPENFQGFLILIKQKVNSKLQQLIYAMYAYDQREVERLLVQEKINPNEWDHFERKAGTDSCIYYYG